MPTVPSFSDPSQQVKPQALPNVQLNVNPSAEAFGGGQSQQNLANATENMGRAFVDVAQEQRARADQIAHIQADTQASQLQTQIQLKVANMKGQDAFGAPDVADQMWQEGISKIRGNLNGQNQQLAFDQTSATRYQDLNKSVQMHVNQQGNEFADQTDQSAITQATNEAVVNAGDNSIVGTNLLRIEDLTQNYARRHGIPEDSDVYKELLTKNLSSAHRDVIQAKLEAGLDNDAKDYFRDNKIEMTAGDVLHATTALDGTEIVSQGNQIWNDIQNQKGMHFSDGSLNVENMREKVMDLDGLSDRKKEQVWSFLKARGKDYNIDRMRTIGENERTFANTVVTAKQNGTPIDQAMINVGKFAIDPYDAAMKAAFIQKTYAPPEATGVIAEQQLKEGIQNGVIALPQVDAAFNRGDITAPKWAELRQLAIKTKTDGLDPLVKDNEARITELATQTLGNNKDEILKFKNTLDRESTDLSPQEKLIKAKELLKDRSSWYSLTKDRQYNTDYQDQISKDTAIGGMYDAMGYKQAQAISAGMAQPQDRMKRNPDPSGDVKAFAAQLGVPTGALKTGSPQNNAIQSLISKGKLVTPAAVQSVLKQYPDGNWK